MTGGSGRRAEQKNKIRKTAYGDLVIFFHFFFSFFQRSCPLPKRRTATNTHTRRQHNNRPSGRSSRRAAAAEPRLIHPPARLATKRTALVFIRIDTLLLIVGDYSSTTRIACVRVFVAAARLLHPPPSNTVIASGGRRTRRRNNGRRPPRNYPTLTSCTLRTAIR